MNVGQECAEIRHTLSTQPRYRKGGTRFFFFFQVCNTESPQFAESLPQRRTYIFRYTSICIVPNIMFTKILRRKQMLRKISGSRVHSRLRADTTSTPTAAAAAAAAAVPGLESTKGSAPGATSGSAEPKLSVVRRLCPSCSRFPSLSPLY